MTKRDILYHYGRDCAGPWAVLPVSGSPFRHLCMGSGSDQPKLPGPGYDLQPGVCKDAGGLRHKRGGYTGFASSI